VSTEHQDGRESENHQRNIIELPGAIGTAIEDNRNNQNERATRERNTRFDQAHGKHRKGWAARVAAGSQAPITLLDQLSVNAYILPVPGGSLDTRLTVSKTYIGYVVHA
jgi:hypothetical protein